MKSHFLRAATKKSDPIAYVGGRVQAYAGTTSNITFSLTSLTGGIDTQPRTGDVVYVFVALGGASSEKTASGYTLITHTRDSRTYATVSLTSSYKVMGATPDTSITVSNGTGSIDNAGAICVSVWRNAVASSDLAFVEEIDNQNSTGASLPNPPLSDTTSTGNVVLAAGAMAHFGGAVSLSSSDLTAFLSVGSNDTNDVSIGVGYKELTTTSYNPAAFTWTGTTSASNSAAQTLIIQQA